MPELEGMDVVQVRSMGHAMQAKADQIEKSLMPAVDHLVSQIPGSWRGPDAQRFKSWWIDQHRPQMKKAADDLHGLGQSALNNADEQDRASAATGSGHASAGGGVAAVATGGAAVTAVGGVGSTTASRPSASPPAQVSSHSASGSGSALAARFSAETVRGKKIGDGQCVQVFEAYNTKVVGAPYVGVGADGGARLFYQNFNSLPYLKDYYTQVPPTGPPQPGDVVVWGSGMGGGYGHIAVCTSSSGGQFSVIEQNDPWNYPVQDHTYSGLNNVIGYLRPKS